MFLVNLILTATAATGAVHLEISPAQSTPGSTTTTISGEGTTSVVAALIGMMKVNSDDLLPGRAARASAADAPLSTTTIRYVSNVTTDQDLLHDAYALALKTGPAAVPPVPTIVGGSPRIVPTTMVSLISAHTAAPLPTT